jgi:hypothetical protein
MGSMKHDDDDDDDDDTDGDTTTTTAIRQRPGLTPSGCGGKVWKIKVTTSWTHGCRKSGESKGCPRG